MHLTSQVARHASKALLLAALIILPLAGFTRSDSTDPCNPPCTDDNATVSFFVGHDHIGCDCWCPAISMTMIVTYYDASTRKELGRSKFLQTGADCYATTAAKVPTCKDLIITVTWTCEGNCANHPPAYQEQYLEQKALPCGGHGDLNVDITCAQWAS